MSADRVLAAGPSLETYLETRFNLLTETLKERQAISGEALVASIEASKALLAANPRYDRPDTGLEPTPPEVISALRAEISAFDVSLLESRDG